MGKTKFNKNTLLWFIGVMFVMSMMPGDGTKAVDQQAIIDTPHMCNVDEDCPTCLGGFASINDTTTETDLTYFEEISYANCQEGTCRLSEYCLVWDCGESDKGCESVKQTLLDNTLSKLNERPIIFLLTIALLVALIML